MIRILLICILWLGSGLREASTLQAQGFELITLLSEYSIGDTISLEFKTSRIPDTVIALTNPDCYVLPEQSTSTSIMFSDGIKTESYSITIKIVFLKEGNFGFHPPLAVNDTEINRSKDVVLKIKKGKLTREETEYLKQKLTTRWEYPAVGAKRYTLLANSGYIEEYTVKGWEFKRRLTEKEFEKLTK